MERMTMKHSIRVWMSVLPWLVVSATDCRIIEYPTYFEATCMGDVDENSEASAVAMEQAPTEEIIAASQAPDPEQNPPGETVIVRSDLAVLLGKSWLQAQQQNR